MSIDEIMTPDGLRCPDCGEIGVPLDPNYTGPGGEPRVGFRGDYILARLNEHDHDGHAIALRERINEFAAAVAVHRQRQHPEG